jgi:ATP-dependent exoDNAse (exonuclease V) beta subunit
MEPKPGHLQTQLKSLSQKLFNNLNALIYYLPDDDSTQGDRETIDIMQTFCQVILNKSIFHRELVPVFEIDLETDFLLARSDQLTSR